MAEFYSILRGEENLMPVKNQGILSIEEQFLKDKAKRNQKPAKRANDLDGKEWTKYSISLWNDIRKSAEELKIKHPAMFPTMLVERLLKAFTKGDEKIVLDPFMGSGSTLVSAVRLGKIGIGFEISEKFVDLARKRLSQGGLSKGELFVEGLDYKVYCEDARNLLNFVSPASVDICITSPPYWNILEQKRTADNKEKRNYGEDERDISKMSDYEEFLNVLAKIFKLVLKTLKPQKYCIVNVMDLRKGDRFFPLHSDLAQKLVDVGFIYDDLIIWDRRNDYSNLRPLGFPSVFRINKVHEYLLIFRKPNGDLI